MILKNLKVAFCKNSAKFILNHSRMKLKNNKHKANYQKQIQNSCNQTIYEELPKHFFIENNVQRYIFSN